MRTFNCCLLGELIGILNARERDSGSLSSINAIQLGSWFTTNLMNTKADVTINLQVVIKEATV